MDSLDSIPFGGHAAPGPFTVLRLPASCVGELLGMTLSGAFAGERQTYIERHSSDTANGFYQRKVNVAGLPTRVSDPRTRTDDFRPAVPPGPPAAPGTRSGRVPRHWQACPRECSRLLIPACEHRRLRIHADTGRVVRAHPDQPGLQARSSSDPRSRGSVAGDPRHRGLRRSLDWIVTSYSRVELAASGIDLRDRSLLDDLATDDGAEV